MKWAYACVLAIVLEPSLMAKTVLIGVHESYPWSFAEGNTIKGAEVDFIAAALNQKGVSFKFEISGYDRLLDRIGKKQLDFASPIPDELIQKFGGAKTDDYMFYTDIAMTLKGKKISTYKNLHGMRIVSYQQAKNFLGKDFQNALKMAKSYKELAERDGQIRMLKSKRVDVVVGEKQILLGLAKKYKIRDKVEVGLVLKKWNIQGLVFDKKLLNDFNEGLKKIKQDGTYDAIVRKWDLIRN